MTREEFVEFVFGRLRTATDYAAALRFLIDFVPEKHIDLVLKGLSELPSGSPDPRDLELEDLKSRVSRLESAVYRPPKPEAPASADDSDEEWSHATIVSARAKHDYKGRRVVLHVQDQDIGTTAYCSLWDEHHNPEAKARSLAAVHDLLGTTDETTVADFWENPAKVIGWNVSVVARLIRSGNDSYLTVTKITHKEMERRSPSPGPASGLVVGSAKVETISPDSWKGRVLRGGVSSVERGSNADEPVIGVDGLDPYT